MSDEIKLKPWPSDASETVLPSDLIQPVKVSLKAAYALERRPEVRDIPYDGYDVGRNTRVTGFGPEDNFREEFRERLGKDDLDSILTLLFQLGYEQGQRALRHEQQGLSGGRSFSNLLEFFDDHRFDD